MPLLTNLRALAEIDNNIKAEASNIKAEDLEFVNNLYKQTNEKIWFAIKEKYKELLRLKNSKITKSNSDQSDEGS